ncbi:helix-turn-helix transcriptional regulator [Laceyella putida]|uniref:Helix-turn-helix transcriptional regulator n=1 Tax=Laceyella putida TaxID=110101 RepID=A0ABW2RQE4_9BACL
MEELVLKRLVEIRSQRGLTQEQVAQRLMVHKSTYNRMESGGIKIKIIDIPRIAEALGMTVDELNKALFSALGVA